MSCVEAIYFKFPKILFYSIYVFPLDIIIFNIY